MSCSASVPTLAPDTTLFCREDPTRPECNKTPTTTTASRQYNCVAEQVSPKYPTCGTNVGNDPNYICFEQVGQTICSRGSSYEPCADDPTSFACANKIEFCNGNPTDSQCHVTDTNDTNDTNDPSIRLRSRADIFRIAYMRN